MVLGAAIAPWIYQAGKGLAMHAAANDAGKFIEWLGAACGRAKFSRFYSRSLVISAIVLLPFLFWRIRALRGTECQLPGIALRVSSWRCAFIQMLVGFAIAGALLWSAGVAVEMMGTYRLNPSPPTTGKFLNKIMIPAAVVPLLEEWLFRGVLLGLWLKMARPLVACLGTSLFFAFIHFLEPPDGSVIADPTSAFAGFELLGKILLHFTDPQFFITDFAVLFAIGMVLAWARVRTGGLWFPIGLHAGWIFAFKGFNLLHTSVEDSPLRPWVVGDSLRSGLVPLFTLGVTALVCHFAMRPLTCQKKD